MKELTIKLIWKSGKMIPDLEELNGLRIPSAIQISLKDIPPFFDSLIFKGYLRGNKFCIENAYLILDGRHDLRWSELNELLYEAGYPNNIENSLSDER